MYTMQNFPNIPIDVSQDLYSEIDNSYFPAGKTPKYMRLTFTGIQQGALWLPDDPPYSPPSGTFKLTHTAENQWDLILDYLEMTYNYVASHWRVFAWYHWEELYYPIFFNWSTDWPYHADKNLYDTYEGTIFYGGFFECSWFGDSDPNSIGQIADRVGFERSTKSFFQGIARTETTGVYRFARRKDASCIKIVVDKSE